MSASTVHGPDRMWAGETVVVAVGPCALPSRSDVERALLELARYPEATRIGRLPRGRRWEYSRDLPGFVRGCVHELPTGDGDRAEALVRALEVDRAGRPFAVILCGELVLLVIDHVLGDGYFMTRLLGAVLDVVRTGEVPAALTRPVTRRPLTTATWSFFGRHPEHVRALVAHVRRSADRPAQPSDAGVEREWRPSPASRVRSSGPAPLKELKAWRREHASGVSTIPLSIAAAEVARMRAGVTLAAAPLVLFDARRYVRPGGADVAGNFCAGIRLELSDNGDPLELDEAIKRAAALGRPLAVVAAASAAGRLRPSRSVPPPPVRSGTVWDVAYSHMGKPAELARQAFKPDGAAPFFIGLLPPNGLNGVAYGISETGNQLNVSVSFHGNVVPGDLVDEVLDQLCSDPAGLLESHRVASAGPPARPRSSMPV